MIPSLKQIANLALGLDAQQLNFWQMGLRAAIIYVAALIMVRIVGDRRFIGKYAAFDVILSIIFGSTLSRAINGGSAFFATIFAGFVLVAMHWLFSAFAFHFTQFENKIKGRSLILIRDGQLCLKTMAVSHITKQDLESTLRLKCQIDRLEQVDRACLERNGDISFSLSTKLTKDSQ
ncbi:putative membrane protein [Hyella patelloides LEGE 07179]|uniref:Putative membrane protein n=1 Tax=Hyella patelloides LEGE 07179 TaxID=945734 RepID=A0A563VJ68_9CYAN|nr:YetF domain-containing protein [Hyella patelloides]VEP11357.1 putative membrane protein [Hyella patelloides LEGE 07179]